MADTVGRPEHWDATYEAKGAQGVSWYQPVPRVSLDLIRQMEVAVDTPVIDVGGGESMLVDSLLAQGFANLTVLDISKMALANAHARVGSALVRWVEADVRT